MKDFEFEKYPGLRMVLLFGSRARGEFREESDWDFGYLAHPDFDDTVLYTDLVLALETDKVDLVDLSRANGLLRYSAASENHILFEACEGVFENFWLEAVHFWCENAAIFRAEYNALIEGLGLGALNKDILAEHSAAVERHLKRLSAQLPKSFKEFYPESNASDAVILHLWQAVQIIIDTATAACVHFHLGTPISYSDAFLKLAEAGYLDKELAIRHCHATGFRNRIVHAYEKLDMQKVYNIAQAGPQDLRSFLASIAHHL